MTEPTNAPEDNALRALYASHRDEPDAALDARILAAARDAAAQPPRRKWRYPVGVGAAASALLAVVLMLQTPQSTDELRPLGQSSNDFTGKLDAPARAPASTVAEQPAAPSPSLETITEPAPVGRQVEERIAAVIKDSGAEDTAAEDAVAVAGSSVPEELAAAAPTVAQESRPAKASLAKLESRLEASVASGRAMLTAETHREIELGAADRAPVSEACRASEHIATDGVALCIDDHQIQVHDAGRCDEVLTLERTTLGTVTLAREDGWIVILIDDARTWRVRCAVNTWQVEALR